MAHGDARMGRRLAAVLAADVVGYSRLMGVDEDAILARLRTYREELIDPAIAKRRGRLVKTTGDGLLVEFTSVLDAVECAVEVQQRLARRNSDVPEDRRILYRMGINTGDIVVDGDDIQGDGVNVAARLEAMAEPGGICISGDAYNHLKAKLPVGFEDLGPQRLKNIAEPVRVLRIRLNGSARIAPLARLGRRGAVLPLAAAAAVAIFALAGTVAWLAQRAPTQQAALSAAPIQTVAAAAQDLRPALIVLPFANLSNDPEQEYFADGFTEDLTTALSRFPGFLVTARNTAFPFKGKSVNAQQVGRDLGVRYVLEGSVRKQGDRLRMNAQLIETATGNHVWAEKFDRPLSDIFIVQDELADRIVGTTAEIIKRREGERALAASQEKLEAYELTMRARLLALTQERDSVFEARRLAERAIALDPSFASAHSALQIALAAIFNQRWNEEYNLPATIERAAAAAARAVALDPANAVFRIRNAAMLSRMRQFDASLAEAEVAFTLNPNDLEVLGVAAAVFRRNGKQEQAVELIKKVMQLNAHISPDQIGILGNAQYELGRYREAAEVARTCLQRTPSSTGCRTTLIAALGQVGPAAEARAAVAELLRLAPGVTLTNERVRLATAHRDQGPIEHFLDGLRKAGVPE